VDRRRHDLCTDVCETEWVLRAIFRFVRRLFKTSAVLVIGFTVVPLVMVGIALAIVLFAPVPITVPAKKALPQIQPTRVYDANGDLLTVFRKVDSNLSISGKDIPRILRKAVIAAEDRRFYTHSGVDAIGLVRALRRDLKTGQAEQGASTITQQLVNNVYYPEDDPEDATKPATPLKRNLNRGWRKLRVAVIANRLDRTMEKEAILEEYLSNIFLGNGAYGVGAASQFYFRKNIKELTISEAATIAGIIPAPSKYEPRRNRSNAEFKRKVTLAQMRREKFITADEYAAALAQELWVDPGDGTVPPVGQPVTIVYGRTAVAKAYPYFTDYVERYLIAKYGEDMVYGGGLTVRTTIDPRMQVAAEKTAASALKGTKATLEMSIVSVEPITGFVKALVGGRSFEIDQVNLALGKCQTKEAVTKRLKGRSPKIAPKCDGSIDGGGSGRSPGSTIKPIVLAAAFEQNFPPSLVLSGSSYRDPRCNKGEKCTTIRNLRQATIRSVNTAYARLGYEIVTLPKVAEMAQKLGITSAWFDPRVHGPSYSIGGIDVAPLEMAAAFSVFAGRGRGASVTPILTITDPTGKLLEDNLSRLPKQIITEKVADNVTNILQAVVEEGTAKRAALGDRSVAGKTGTSQDSGNAWFVGYTPTLSTAVWLGYKDRPRKIILPGYGLVEGGELPAKTWSRYMASAMDGVPPSEFGQPAPIIRPRKLSVKEETKFRERKEIDPGRKRVPIETPIPRYSESLGSPPVVEPALLADPTLPPSTTPTPPTVIEPLITVPVVTAPPATTPPATAPPATAPVTVPVNPV
jgi:penicillin-binding protein 1A